MKRLLMAITLVCVLSASALAGDMPAVNPAPTSNGTQSSAAVTLAGEMPTVGPAPTSNRTQSSAIATVLLTIISIVAR
ncbi:MAG: hypothetical protein QOF62_1103 [Pyrinomonadaceae bacterium]|nr:hypothetical protein [Pyrinomonadaceae bacterium]